jgi:hypothetical protein
VQLSPFEGHPSPFGPGHDDVRPYRGSTEALRQSLRPGEAGWRIPGGAREASQARSGSLRTGQEQFWAHRRRV